MFKETCETLKALDSSLYLAIILYEHTTITDRSPGLETGVYCGTEPAGHFVLICRPLSVKENRATSFSREEELRRLRWNGIDKIHIAETGLISCNASISQIYTSNFSSCER